MPPKRKTCPVDTVQEPPQKRRTRSSGILVETHLENVSPPRPRQANKPGLLSEDELLLSPSKRRSSQLKGTPPIRASRLVMESVEIVTPSRQLTRIPLRDTGSPVPLTPKAKKHGGLDIPHSSSRRTVLYGSPSRIARNLPQHFHSCLQAQKAAILRSLQNPPEFCAESEDEDDQGPPTNEIAFKQLSDLLKGTVERGEGNSCLLLGPKGSGKTRVSLSFLYTFVH
jgi:origin recognition complex subunit 4